MKTKLLLFSILFISIIHSGKLQAQDAQLISKEINYELYSDAGYKSFISSSGFFDFKAKILWNYADKSIEIIDMVENTTWLKTKYKTEVNPDNIKGDENFRFEFDPTKNSLKIKVIKIYFDNDGNFTYKIDADKQKIIINGIESDLDYDGVGDRTQANNNNTDNNYVQGGQNVRYLNFNNITKYDIYISAFTLPNAFGDWVQTNGWIKIPAGSKVYFGDSAEEYFYYYAYCKDSNGQFLTWEGTDRYDKVGTDGPYGFRKINLSIGTQDDQNNWTLDLFIK